MGGEITGGYSIVEKIGEGGMGAVSLAEHTLLGRRAAIKVLLHDTSHRRELVTRFFNEARAATSVNHPGIVEIYDFGYHTNGFGLHSRNISDEASGWATFDVSCTQLVLTASRCFGTG